MKAIRNWFKKLNLIRWFVKNQFNLNKGIRLY